ncbi:Asp23/Gls24 family envelope stress response protein [Mycolicibacterium sp. P1-18]|uniref:Asp23/Gls24 family envelope stress response protein n=1 Tax=Mycolicibacterium sp. P1-18 TaxID=2024615 RepID=UPI0011F34FE8|nr:Asp23/Gls24 family envelope stress response protein [Mycolicibacterium sp. P1-18]KAA0092772.1 Asp23/Gls24 family envelope stress response protein [Mycolicibacterium sp. P1-18]
MADDDLAVDPGDRGGLTVRDKVAQRLAVHAARLTDGVHQHSAGLTKITGRELPRATVAIAGDRARVQVNIAVAWPEPAVVVGAAVQRNVVEALRDYAALTVDRVDVAVDAVLPVTAPSRTVQ